MKKLLILAGLKLAEIGLLAGFFAGILLVPLKSFSLTGKAIFIFGGVLAIVVLIDIIWINLEWKK